MQYRVFTVPVTGSPELEEDLNHFLRSHKVITVQKAVETIGGSPCWCFCVEFIEGGVSSGNQKFSGRSKKVDYKEVLSEDDFAVFARLREKRKELAGNEAIPVYAICTNEQLAAIATKRPVSLTELKEIEGIGEAKAEKYGLALLEILDEMKRVQDEKSRQTD
jgi:superfamily II DNA helicase RecQ